MDLHLTNKLVLTTSSIKGISKTVAIEMAREGTDVIINGRNEAEVTKAIREIQIMSPDTHPQIGTADISIESQRATLSEKFPKVNILVNNMGISELAKYWDIDDATWEKFLTVNVLLGSALAKAHLSKMLTQDSDRIILIASEEAAVPSDETPQYSMTKTMNLSLAKSLSNSTVDTHITVNTVMSDPALTRGVEKMLEDMYTDSDTPKGDWEKDFMKNHRSHSQIRRLIQSEKIGRLVTLVTSPNSSPFPGEALRADGGLVPTIL